MITEHQPSLFPKHKLAVGMSSVEDGNMRFRVAGNNDDEAVLTNRQEFLAKFGLSMEQTELVYVTFDASHYTRFRVVSAGSLGRGITQPDSTEPADGLATNEPNHALFLPLADCNGLILYDEPHHALLVAHIGRHSTVEDGAKKAVEFMAKQYHADAADILAWLSPAVGQDSYAMEAIPSDPAHFNFVDDPRWCDFRRVDGDKVYINLTGYNRRGLLEAGVKAENIEVCEVDTAKDPRYPSHSNGKPGRYAIVAALR